MYGKLVESSLWLLRCMHCLCKFNESDFDLKMISYFIMSIVYTANTLVDLVNWFSLLSILIGFQFTSFVSLIYCALLLLVYFVSFHWWIFTSFIGLFSNLLYYNKDTFVTRSYLVLNIFMALIICNPLISYLPH